ncbi:MAG: glycoside hydrolase family 43 protein [Paraprevotella sp.]|nr:glycoside hydrolase family 43 protein [Paraprevotella sp.]
MRKNLKTLLGICLMCIGAMASTTSLQAKKKVAYLFTYFTGNAPEQEQIHYAISRDGFNYTPLNNGRPVIASDTISIKKGLRDPHILRGEDGYFYMVVTDMRASQGWASNRGLVLMRSKDLVNWSHHTVDFPEKYAGTMFAHATRVWAPQTIYDKDAKKYMVYFSILTDDGTCPYDKVFWAYANKDFSDLEGEPQVLFDYKKPSIDTDIVEDEKGIYHIFFKTEGERKKGIRQYLAKDMHKPSEWQLLPGTFEDTDKAVEGSGVFRRIEGDWVLMYDCYLNGYYQFCTSKDLKSFKRIQDTATKGDFTPRHGTVITITQPELDRIEKAFPNTK